MNSKPNLGGSSIKWIVWWEEKREKIQTNPYTNMGISGLLMEVATPGDNILN